MRLILRAERVKNAKAAKIAAQRERRHASAAEAR